MEEELSKLQLVYQEAVLVSQEQKLLITQLEEDLRSVNALSSMFRGDAEGEPGPQSHVDPGTEALAEVVGTVVNKGSTVSDGTQSAADSLLPIVQSQRERYRTRAQELEAQNLSQQQQLTILRNEIDKLRSDNVKLYEKIRFLQSYPSTSKSSRDDGTETRYSSQYEDRLDPFSTFNKKERQRRYMNLKPYDKITLSMGRFIMGNKVARTFTFFYTLMLHCLVFLALYKVAHTESCKRDLAADCHDQFAAHMLKVHGNKEFNIGHDQHNHP